jgi:hypothetical protein
MTDDSEVLDGRADDVVEQREFLSQMAVAQPLNVIGTRIGGNKVLLKYASGGARPLADFRQVVDRLVD